jgi:hypothetical protein
MTGKYILDENHNAFSCDDLIKLAIWLDKADRIVDKNDIGIPFWKFYLGKWFKIKKWEPIYISTVFLGLNYKLGEGEPLLFETMVFGGKHDGEMERYTTWHEAAAGHKKMVEKVKSDL